MKRRDGRSFTFDIIAEIGLQNFLLDPIDARRLGFPYGGLMDVRKLVLGLTGLAIVAGLLLVCFAPGGWFNKGKTERAEVKTPIGSLEFSTRESKSSNWPTVGYVLLGAGGIGVVAFVSMKSPQR